MPPRITRKSYRPRVSDRTMVDTPYNHYGLHSFKIEWRCRHQNTRASEMEKENQRRWSGADQNQASVIARRGWKSSNFSQLPVEEEIFSLTFPFIEQAFSLACAFCSPRTGPIAEWDVLTFCLFLHGRHDLNYPA